MEQQTAWVKRDGKWSQEIINKQKMKLTTSNKKGTNPLKPKFPKIHIDHSKDIVMAFTDGGCHPNGKPVNKGGYAFVVVEHDKVLYDYSKSDVNTTNNKMELQAIIDCLCWISEEIPETTQVLLHSDSQYCIHGIQTWRHNWMKKGWKDVKNAEQWKILSALVDSIQNVQYKWIRAHQEDGSIETKYNNIVDELCCKQMAGIKQPDIIQEIKKSQVRVKTALITANELLIDVYREMRKDEIISKGSHGLRTNITEYLKENKLI